jgi:hypothetical protein
MATELKVLNFKFVISKNCTLNSLKLIFGIHMQFQFQFIDFSTHHNKAVNTMI